MEFLVHIHETNPESWRSVEAPNPEEAAFEALCHAPEMSFPCPAHVGDPDFSTHSNSAPIVVHEITMSAAIKKECC